MFCLPIMCKFFFCSIVSKLNKDTKSAAGEKEGRKAISANGKNSAGPMKTAAFEVYAI